MDFLFPWIQFRKIYRKWQKKKEQKEKILNSRHDLNRYREQTTHVMNRKSRQSKKEKRRIARLNEKIKKSEDLDTVINDLGSYKLKYSDVPTIYNYLGIAYQRANQLKKYYRTLVETREKFPDYIFGKISLAEYYLSDNKFEITQHFPVGTEVFHVSAVRGFYYITGRYFAKVGKIELAYKSYFLISDLDIDAQSTEILGHEIIGYELGGLKKKMRNHKRRK
jgi:hypothetical protein